MNLVLRPMVRAAAALLLTAAVGAGPAAPAGAAPPHQGFVTRSGSHLLLDGRPFRFSGPNMYWLGLDENVGGVAYPTYFRIRDGLLTAKAMSSTVVRAHTLGVSTGNPLSVEPALDRFNDDAFAPIDYAVAEAGRLGLRLMIPLTDNWQYYHGGRFDFVHWYGLTDGAAFYTDPQVIAAFQRYVAHVLDHVNPYTGRALRDDPTVMAWELGNELNGMPAAWIDRIGGYLRGLAPHQLVAAGQQGGINPATLTASDVDIVDVHYYPPTADGIAAHAATVAAAGKVYVAGEYGSNSATPALLDALAADADVSGALFWSLFPHNDEHGYVQHDDGFTLHYPGDTPAMRQAAAAITAFGATLGGPARGGTAQPPLITALTRRFGENVIAWRGAAGASSYRLERSARGPLGPWQTLATLTDNDTPWLDASTPQSRIWYRVSALDAAGRTVSRPDVADNAVQQDLAVDPLPTWAKSSGHSDTLRITPSGAAPADGRAGWLTYAHKDLQSVTVSADGPRLDLSVSADGTHWRPARPMVRPAGDGHWQLSLEHLTGVAAVRIDWPRGIRTAVSQVALQYATDTPLNGKPGPFAVAAPAPGATGVNTGTAVTWSASAGATSYSLVLSAHPDLSQPVATAGRLLGTTFQPAVRLSPGTTYYVKVTAANAAGGTDAAGSFTTKALPTSDVPVEGFEEYPSDAALQAAYPANAGGDPIAATLVPGQSGNGARLTFQGASAGYAGVIHTFPAAQDWTGTAGLSLWAGPDAAGRKLTVQFVAGGTYWEATTTVTGAVPQVIRLPFTSFAVPPWATPAPLTLDTVTQLSCYVGGTGSLTLDSLAAYVS